MSSPMASPLQPTPCYTPERVVPDHVTTPAAPMRPSVQRPRFAMAGAAPTRLTFDDEPTEVHVTPARVVFAATVVPPAPMRRRTKHATRGNYGPRRLAFTASADEEPASPTGSLSSGLDEHGSLLPRRVTGALRPRNRLRQVLNRRQFLIRALENKARRQVLPIKQPSASATEEESGGDDDEDAPATAVSATSLAASPVPSAALDVYQGAPVDAPVLVPTSPTSILRVRAATTISPPDPLLIALNARLERLVQIQTQTNSLLDDTHAFYRDQVTINFLSALGMHGITSVQLPRRFHALCQSMFSTLHLIAKWARKYHSFAGFFGILPDITQAPSIQEPEAATSIAGYLEHIRKMDGVICKAPTSDDQFDFLNSVLHDSGTDDEPLTCHSVGLTQPELLNEFFILMFGTWHHLSEHSYDFVALACSIERLVCGTSVIGEMEFVKQLKIRTPLAIFKHSADTPAADPVVSMHVSNLCDRKWWNSVLCATYRCCSLL